MSEDWLLAVDLGSFAMAGTGLLFVVVWLMDRSRSYALRFAGAIAGYIAATLSLSLALNVALASSIHGVLFPGAMLLLADGLLRRVGDRLPRWTVLGYLLPTIGVVWFFAYAAPLMVARIITQNLGTALLLVVVVRRLSKQSPRTGPDRSALTAAIVLTVALGVDVVAALFSPVPREILTNADLDSYLRTNLELCLIISSAVVLPAFMIAMLATTVIDIVRELRRQRDCDELTGLLNRRGFNRRADVVLRDAVSCVVILADLDHFKMVNDTLGHMGGDEVLIAFARILDESPVTGSLVGRLGGEEFGVLLPDARLESVVAWVESVRVRLAAQSVEISRGATTVTASFGMATGQPGARLTDLLGAADKALYQAKDGGRNQTVVSG